MDHKLFMKRLATYSLLFGSIFLLQVGAFSPAVGYAQTGQCIGTVSVCDNLPIVSGAPSCNDGKDNFNDGKADYCGVDCTGPAGVPDGKLDLEPDPSCKAPKDTEKEDLPAGELLSCYNYCTFSDVLKTINKFITFLITTLFVPTIILLFMLAGFKYLTAQGNPSKVANLKKMIINIVVGMLLVLCSWLIVKVLLTILVRDDDSALQFLE